MWADALPNLLIGLREGLEAGLVVSILLAAVRKHSEADNTGTSRTVSTTPIWIGVAAAIVLALSFGAVLTFYRSVLSSTGQEALGGFLSVIAVGLVTAMIFWMRRTARNLAGELRERVDQALRISTAALALTAFIAVGREGTETALFLWTAAQASGQTTAPVAGAAIGIAAAVILCVLLYHRAVKIRLDKFFGRTAILLIIVAGGVLAYGLGDLQEAGVLPGHLWVAFDLTAHIDPSSWWMSIITGSTELSPSMTWLQVVAYICYLGVVLPIFIWGRPALTPARPIRGEPAPVPRMAAERAPRDEVQAVGRRRSIAAVTAAFTVPPVVAGTLIAVAPGATGATDHQLTVTATTCAQGWSAVQAGEQSFTISNKSGHVVEINLIQSASQGIVAEIETLGPGTRQTLSVALAPGSYFWRCPGSSGAGGQSATATVTGSTSGAAPVPVKPVTVADLQPALRAYNSYVAGKLTTLASQVAKIRAELGSGNLTAARTDWLPAMLTWEQVGEEPYGSFGDFGVEIAAGPQGFEQGVNDPDFTGLHRLEYGLWHGQKASALIPVTNQLAKYVTSLQSQLDKLSNDPTSLPVRSHEVLEDALRDHLTGQLDQGSGADYAETLADVQADRVVLGEIANLITARAPHLLPAVYSELNTLRQALLATRVNGQWVSINAVSLTQRQDVDAAIGAVLENTSLIPDLLETPAH
ncbi:MAG TPA: iron uptake transporter permease EfeU [Streptosporangiaceae bacterium]